MYTGSVIHSFDISFVVNGKQSVDKIVHCLIKIQYIDTGINIVHYIADLFQYSPVSG